MKGRGDAIEVDWALIDLAMKEHEDTHARSLIHAEILTFVEGRNLFRMAHRDEAIDKLSDILQNVRFKPEHLRQSPRLSMSLLESKVFSFEFKPTSSSSSESITSSSESIISSSASTTSTLVFESTS